MRKDTDRKKIIILGSGLFAEEVADYISVMKDYDLIGFVEGANHEKCSETLLGLPVIWIDDVTGVIDSCSCKAVCAVGSTKRNSFIQQATKSGLSFTTIVHPASHISLSVILGIGTIISPGAIVAVSTRIGDHVIINRGGMIGHHVEIGNYVTISPGANIAGKTKIGDGCYIGMGAVILDGITIGNNSIVGAGSVVTKDVPSFVQVLGLPARVSKEIKE